MGGGGFSDEPDNPLLDDFTLSLTGKNKPNICFLSQASGEAITYLDKFYQAFTPDRALASHLKLFSRDDRDLRTYLLDQHVIYVGGGNTANLLAIWRIHGLDKILREAWNAGIILAGISAGMICWFQSSITDSFGLPAPLHDGLAFLNGSACPHYDSEPNRRPTYHRCIKDQTLPPGIAADDGAALHFIDTTLHEAVSSQPNAAAYHVTLTNNQIVETQIPTRYLGNTSSSQ